MLIVADVFDHQFIHVVDGLSNFSLISVVLRFCAFDVVARGCLSI